MFNLDRGGDWGVTSVTAVFSRAAKVSHKSKEFAKRNITSKMSAFTYIVLIGFAIFGIQYWLKNKSYVFEAEDIAKITKRHVGNGKCSIRKRR